MAFICHLLVCTVVASSLSCLLVSNLAKDHELTLSLSVSECHGVFLHVVDSTDEFEHHLAIF